MKRPVDKADRSAAGTMVERHAASLAPVITELRAAGITTLTAIAREMNNRGIPAARGGSWSWNTAACLLTRLGHPLVKVKPRPPAAQLAVHLHAKGVPLPEIVQALNAKGFPAPGRTKTWRRNQVNRLLQKTIGGSADRPHRG
jgi:hypothetical protein